MIIEQEDFRMESSNNWKPYWFWDLYLLKVVNEGKSSERSEIKWDGWGCWTTICAERIAKTRTSIKLSNESETRTFKEIYEEEYSKIFNFLKTFPEDEVRTERIIFEEYKPKIIPGIQSKKKKTKK